MSTSEAERRLNDLYAAHAVRVHTYARRHCGSDGADEVLSQTFMVAWRRLDNLPADPLPWLIAIARNVIANRRRSLRRGLNLTLAIQSATVATASDTADIVVDRLHLVAALESLSAKEREALLLVAWDGLTAEQAASALGCGERAFRGRVTRARRHLAESLGDPPAPEPEPARHSLAHHFGEDPA